MGKVWLIASGKGGVGKSMLSAALGSALAKMKQTVCIVDADIGLRDQDAILGLENRVVYDIVDVANRTCRLNQALLQSNELPCLSLLPASQFARVKELDARAFSRIIGELRQTHDHVLIDCPAGIERGLRGLLKCEADACILVCTPDDVCMRDAERAADLLDKKGLPRPMVVVNRIIPDLVAANEMYNARTVSDTLELSLLGEIPEDSNVYRGLIGHIPLMEIDCEAQRAISRIARRMVGQEIPLPAYGNEKTGWFARLFKRKLKEVKRLDS